MKPRFPHVLRTTPGSVKNRPLHLGARVLRPRVKSLRVAGGKARRRLKAVALLRLRRSRTGRVADVVEAVQDYGPQQVFRLFPWLTRLVAAWSLLAFFATDLPVRAAVTAWNGSSDLLWTNPSNWVSGVPGALDIGSVTASNVSGGTIYLNGDASVLGLAVTAGTATSTSLLGGASGAETANIFTLGTSGISVLAGAGTVTVGTSVTVAVTGDTPLNVASGSTLNVLTPLSGTGSLLETGGGVVRLGVSGALSVGTLVGDITVDNGVLVVKSPGALGAANNTVSVNGVNAAGFNGAMVILEGGTGQTFTQNFTLAGRGATVNSGGAALLSLGNNVLSGNVQFGNSSTPSALASGYGNLTISGAVNLGSSQNLVIYGNGNTVISGPVSSQELSNDRLMKQSQTVGTTLWLQNPNNTFLSTMRIDGGFVRVSSGGALGANTSLSGSNLASIQFNNGVLEIRADPATVNTFSSKTISVYNNSGTIFLDRAVGGTGFAQTIQTGTFSFNNGARTINLGGRDGYGLSFGTASSVIAAFGNGATGNDVFNNGLNGWLTVNGSANVGSNDGFRLLYFQGNGDTIWNGTISTTLANGFLTGLGKNGQGLAIFTGTTAGAGVNGIAKVDGGILQIGTFAVLSDPIAQLSGIQLGSTTPSTGGLNYAGTSGETTTRIVSMAGTTGNALIFANQSGSVPLVLAGGVVAGGSGAKALLLGGTSVGGGSITTMISELGGSTALFKSDTGTWVYAPSITGTISGGTTTTSAGANTNMGTLTVTSTLGIYPGMVLTGTNFSGIVTAIKGNTLWLSTNNNGTTAVTSGTLVTFGSLSSFTGNLTLTAGTMRLQAQSATSDLLGASAQVIFNQDTAAPGLGRQNAGGRLEYVAFGGNSTESAGTLTLTAGLGVVAVTAGGTLNFGSLGARTAGAMVDFQPGTGTISLGGSPLTNGILGGWATYNGLDFAGTLTGGSITAVTGTAFVTSGGSAGTNYLLSGGTTTAGTLSLNSLKITGSGTLALGGTLSLASGGLLFDNSTGAYTISGGSLGASGAELMLTVNGSSPGNALTISSTIGAGATALTKSGTGLLVIAGSSNYTGNVTINAGTLRLSGVNANLGAPTTAIDYVRQNAVLDLGGAGISGTLYVGSGSFATTKLGALTGSGLVDNVSSAPVVLSLGATSTGVFTGIIQNSVADGSVSLWRNAASGTQFLTGLNTYTGATVISGGATLSVNSLANGSVASAIGMSSNAASNLVFNNGVLQYTGSNASFVQFTQTPSISIDRLFTLAGNGFIDSSGQFGNNNLATGSANNAALVFANTGTIAFAGTGNRTLTLQGNSTGDNEIALKLVDNTLGGSLSLTKASTSQWLLTGTNTYTGVTSITGGVLQAQDGVGLPTNSNLTLNGGVFQSNGTFSRTLGTGAGQVQFGSSGGGFSASGTRLVVNLGGTVSMGTGAFAGSILILNAANAPGDVDFQSGLNLGTAARTIQVDDNANTGMDFATISGIISGGTGFSKSSTGNLILTGANTYSGSTYLQGGALIVQSIGAAGVTASNLGTNVSGGSLYLGNNSTSVTASLLYVGAGETATRPIALNNNTAGITIDSSGSGALVLTNVPNVNAAARILTLRGLNTDNNMITSVLTDGGTSAALSVTKSDGGVWVLAPSTANTFTGAIAANGGLLGLSQAGLGSATSVSIGGGGIFAVGGSLTIGVNVSLANNNPFNSFAGSNPITVTGTITGGYGNPWYLINSMDNGAVLTLGNFVAANETSDRTLYLKGYGSTAFTGTISNNSTNKTSVDIRVANNATVTMGSISGFSGGLLLYQGILVANNPTVVAGTSVLGAAGALFTFGGGELRSNYAMTGANAFQNPVSLTGDSAVVSGTSSIEFAGTLTGGGKILQNDLSGGATLTVSGSSNFGTTSLFQGAANTTVSGNIYGAGGPTFQGTGTLTLSGSNSFTGALTVNRGLVVLSGGGTAASMSGANIYAGGTLRLDDSSGGSAALRMGTLSTVTSNGGVFEVLAGSR